MFSFFFSLYYSLFVGNWFDFGLIDIEDSLASNLNALGELVTSIFGDNTMNNLGDKIVLLNQGAWIQLIAFILALITTIGVVVLVVNVIKKIFTVFFYGLR